MGTAARTPDPGPDVAVVVGARTGREARHPLTGGRRVADVVATVVLLVALTLVAIVAAWAIVFLSLNFSSCSAPGNSCNAVLGGAVVYVGPVLVALVVVGAIVWSLVRLVRRRMAWAIPVVGITAVVVVFFACRLLVDAAVTRGI
ncbi:glucan phosphoethanolaminetransferase (alkaline phosphatase superfamily) [Curtobacterium luteum]|uniref:Glucan phosphoethanolaminetransferase (Alkaline phosphatase superfamily) n=1 Tax=Curtobacterium luteum TaxID=33881 RepID=A0A8H9GC59_9MICO|nr:MULTISPECIES: DUF6264 family protein [Curtobacterium]MBM7801127.1 glucan phosphoethanolaminetransferase (alkaline phosphatase superfamily) [Curtobacterium luteum]NUU52494.1 hypothetical protein [Curtobacterium luteum]GGK96609.1 hypothetical protein GCM10009769_13460 [Curtobacterium luteum]